MLFQSVRLAQKKAALVSGAHPKTRFNEVTGLVVISDFEKIVIDKMSPPKELIEHWMCGWQQQKGFMFKNKKGEEIKAVVKPEVNGYSCWLIDKDGIANKIIN